MRFYLFISVLLVCAFSKAQEDALEAWAHAFNNLDKEGMYALYAPNAKIALQFKGMPETGEVSPQQSMDGFFAIAKKGGYKWKFTKIVSNENTLVFHFIDSVTLSNDCNALFTGVAVFDFDRNGKIVRHLAWSDDTDDVVKCIAEFKSEL